MNAAVVVANAPASSVDNIARAGAVITTLVAALARHYALSELERELAKHVLFGRKPEAIAARLGPEFDQAAVEGRVQILFAKTATSTRQQLFDLALRLAATHRNVSRRSSQILVGRPALARSRGESSGAAARAAV